MKVLQAARRSSINKVEIGYGARVTFIADYSVRSTCTCKAHCYASRVSHVSWNHINIAKVQRRFKVCLECCMLVSVYKMHSYRLQTHS